MISQKMINGAINNRCCCSFSWWHIEHHLRALCDIVLIANRTSSVVYLEIVAGIDFSN